MNPLALLGGIIVQTLKSLLPETPEDKLRAIELAIQQQVVTQALLKGQQDINVAEAANPNRTWATWRECLGYVIVIAVSWQWIVVPVIASICLLVDHPLNTTLLPKIDMFDVLYLLCGMLGMDVAPLVANRIRGVKK